MGLVQLTYPTYPTYLTLSVRELVVDSDQLFLGDEIDLDAAFRPLAHDSDASAEEKPEALLGCAGMSLST